ncbi:hypothetical protein BU26DRAFT_570373 [Trematosphaeria pertusa]|uniref:Rhodopsin domain-containing protein n=1 Tax=Trematosphaeria pertusa TaxID=390896 RepID=A0A6A6HY63_9PLEO|nr:uncharacterized protein BU26DRAFT_570373 [Trematosphaeria pertusa]KAF2242957.1 hypothetical protein BU26DRAFT_570373 [Trematosphaeria pertusa]
MFIRPGFVVVIVGITLTSLSTIVVAMRYYCRWYRMGIIGATDHLMMVALILTWGNTVVNYYQDETSRKFRPSYFRRPDKRPQFETALRGTLITWYVYRLTYGVALCFVKLSILFFYRAIASHRAFRRMVYYTIGFVVLYTVGSTIAAAFQCENPAHSWDTSGYLAQFDGNPKTKKPHFKCYDPTKLWVFTAAINLFTDVLILLLPIPTLLGLRVPMTKRLALIGIFSVGIMAIVASCVRMWVMALWSESPQNSARFGADLLLWGQVETNSGIISASVPFLRLFFRRNDRREPEKGVAPAPRKEISPPKPVHTDNKPLQIDSMAFFGPGEDGEDTGPNGSPGWKPFITVPASLSSRGSGMLEPTNAHTTV